MNPGAVACLRVIRSRVAALLCSPECECSICWPLHQAIARIDAALTEAERYAVR